MRDCDFVLLFSRGSYLQKNDGDAKREEKLGLGKLLKQAKENGRRNNAPDYKLVTMQLIIVEHTVQYVQ